MGGLDGFLGNLHHLTAVQHGTVFRDEEAGLLLGEEIVVASPDGGAAVDAERLFLRLVPADEFQVLGILHEEHDGQVFEHRVQEAPGIFEFSRALRQRLLRPLVIGQLLRQLRVDCSQLCRESMCPLRSRPPARASRRIRGPGPPPAPAPAGRPCRISSTTPARVRTLVRISSRGPRTAQREAAAPMRAAGCDPGGHAPPPEPRRNCQPFVGQWMSQVKCSIITTCVLDFARPTSISPGPSRPSGPARKSCSLTADAPLRSSSQSRTTTAVRRSSFGPWLKKD